MMLTAGELLDVIFEAIRRGETLGVAKERKSYGELLDRYDKATLELENTKKLVEDMGHVVTAACAWSKSPANNQAETVRADADLANAIRKFLGEPTDD